MDLVYELCPLQLLEVTKKSDTWAGRLTSIQHLAHISGPVFADSGYFVLNYEKVFFQIYIYQFGKAD